MIRKRRDGPLSAARLRSSAPPGFLVAFFAIVLAAGLLAAKTFLWEPLRNVLRARSWVEAPCVVLSSEVKRHPGDETDTFSVAIRYRDSYRGSTYGASRYDFEPRPSIGRKAKKRIVALFPAGLETTCRVNPDAPSEAVIDRGLGAWAWFALFPIPFVAAGAGGMWRVIRSRREERRQSAEREARSRGAALPALRDAFEPAHGPVTLNPRQGPGLRATGAGCVAPSWNGIVGVFVGFAVKLRADGEGSWLPTLFLVPFVLVGLGLLWAFVKALLAHARRASLLVVTADGRTPLRTLSRCVATPDLAEELELTGNPSFEPHAWAAFARRGGNFRGALRDLCDLARRGTGVV